MKTRTPTLVVLSSLVLLSFAPLAAAESDTIRRCRPEPIENWLPSCTWATFTATEKRCYWKEANNWACDYEFRLQAGNEGIATCGYAWTNRTSSVLVCAGIGVATDTASATHTYENIPRGGKVQREGWGACNDYGTRLSDCENRDLAIYTRGPPAGSDQDLSLDLVLETVGALTEYVEELVENPPDPIYVGCPEC